jgi:hypothetical protein
MISGIVKAIEVLGGRRGSGRVKLRIIKSSSSSSKLEGKLYQVSSSSLVSSELEESGGEKSSN